MFNEAPYESQWRGLRPGKGQQLTKEIKDILHQINRDDIFNSSKYNSSILFHKLHRENDPFKVKRPPNPFIIVRTIFGLVANDNNISIGDGTSHSALAGLVWRSATPEEKARIKKVFQEIKEIHREKYPNYRYRPERNSMNNDKFSNKTAKDFENNIIIQPMMSFPTVEPNSGPRYPLPLYLYPLPSPVPSIAVNCPPMPMNNYDPNEGHQHILDGFGNYEQVMLANTEFQY